MNIARPANGFMISERPPVLVTLAEMTKTCPWLQRAYSNLKERLRMAGHLVGKPVSQKNVGDRVFIDADPETGTNRLAVTYRVLGDAVTIFAMKVILASANT